MRSPWLLLLLAACTDVPGGEPTAPNQLRGDDKSDVGGGPLWAGLTSVTIERYAADPCDDGRRALGDDPVIYDSWARQRAGVRNLCFEVWAPGITDWDNPDFWKQLDVQVRRWFGDLDPITAYVDSNGRRGNNRRYQFPLDWQLDPLTSFSGLTLATVPVPFTILAEQPGWAQIQADMFVEFTVNNRTLNAPSNRPFTIRYQGEVAVPRLAADPAGYVLHDLVTCDGARFGSGAGFFAADIRDPQAIAALGGDLVYAVPVAQGPGLMSLTYSQQVTVPGEALPGFEQIGMRITPHGTTMYVDLDVYDRAAGITRRVSHTFTGCAQ